MPRPTMDVNSPEYQKILHGRQLYKTYGLDCKDVIWAEEKLAKLERKIPYNNYTDQDLKDFERVKEIHARIIKSHSGHSETAENHTTTHYIWHTRGDNKVRSEHAANDGKIFAWNDPPPTGNPGEDFGCRCWAEAYTPKRVIREYSEQTLADAASDAASPWTWGDYYDHYMNENGRSVTLHEMGLLKQIIDRAEFVVYPKIERLIFEKVQRERAGTYSFRWNDSYRFHLREIAIGGATVTVNAILRVKNMGYHYEIEGDLNYDFYDRFSDPRDWFNLAGEDYNLPGSTPFNITDTWSTQLEAIIINESAT